MLKEDWLELQKQYFKTGTFSVKLLEKVLGPQNITISCHKVGEIYVKDALTGEKL